MKRHMVFWSILVAVIVLLIGVPTGYHLATGNHVQCLVTRDSWRWPFSSYDLTLRKADGSQCWIMRRGPIVITSRNFHLTVTDDLEVPCNSIIVGSGSVNCAGGGITSIIQLHPSPVIQQSRQSSARQVHGSSHPARRQ